MNTGLSYHEEQDFKAMAEQQLTYSDLKVGDLFKIDGIYHIQVKAAYDEKRKWIKNPYHSAEHSFVVILDAAPDMPVTLYKKHSQLTENK